MRKFWPVLHSGTNDVAYCDSVPQEVMWSWNAPHSSGTYDFLIKVLFKNDDFRPWGIRRLPAGIPAF